MKIGELVKSHIEKIFHYCETFDQEELERLMGKEYSKKTFNINYPFCKDLSLISDKELVRFWKYDYKVNGKIIRVCSQWIIGNKVRFLDYLLSKNIISKDEYSKFDQIVKTPPNSGTNPKPPKPQDLDPTIFPVALQKEAREMSKHYEILYCLEKTMRNIVIEIMVEKYGNNWWDERIDPMIKSKVAKNREFELNTGYTKLSENDIDYTTFGDLRQIIEANWMVFDGKFKNKIAFKNIMYALNQLRGPIAHCNYLPEDEVTRLNLKVKDWSRLINK